MMGAYAVILLVFGIVLTYLWLIHHFWLRHIFREDHTSTVGTRIMILGGGFGGLYSALNFEKTIAADPTVEVTLVSRENFVLFTPMLHEVAAGDLDLSDIVCLLRKMLKHVRILQADVDGIRNLRLAHPAQHKLPNRRGSTWVLRWSLAHGSGRFPSPLGEKVSERRMR